MKIDRAEFRNWLLTKAPTDIVGIASSNMCPLANFLGRPISYQSPSPGWGNDFRWAVDTQVELDEEDYKNHITAEHALQILDKIP